MAIFRLLKAAKTVPNLGSLSGHPTLLSWKLKTQSERCDVDVAPVCCLSSEKKQKTPLVRIDFWLVVVKLSPSS